MNGNQQSGFHPNNRTGSGNENNQPKSQYRIKQPNPKSIVKMVEEEMEKLMQ